jgi:hypothetical protein
VTRIDPTAVLVDGPRQFWRQLREVAIDFRIRGSEQSSPRSTPLVESNITRRQLIDELDRLAVDRGCPDALRRGNGPELGCAALAEWVAERVGPHFVPPGQPWRNGYIESFNSRVRDECVNTNVFWSPTQARVVISDWKADQDHRQRHSALGYQAPAVCAAARTHDRRSLTAASISRASGCIVRTPVGPVDLERYALRKGSRVEQLKRDVRAGLGE